MTAKLVRGFRDRIDRYADPAREITVEMSVTGNAVYDFTCFGVDAAGKLSDDRYMVFYNQTRTPGGEITLSTRGSSAVFQISLNRLPAGISRLVFTVSIDGSGTMGEIRNLSLTVRQGGGTAAELTMTGSDFRTEKAVISMEIYRKDIWRMAAVCSGFNGGLGDLLRYYGGEEAEPAPRPQPAPVPPPAAGPSRPAPAGFPPSVTRPAPAGSPPAAQKPASGRVSLEKKLSAEAPKLVSLAKPLQLELEKRNLQDCEARVALVLDISGSMSGRYSDGTVQNIVNRTLPLAVQFDDDGELDFWYYGSRCRRMPSVNLRSYESAVPHDWHRLMRDLGYGNDEPVVMREVMDEYRGSRLPAYVLFITDGGVGHTGDIRRLLVESSRMPIFWQFVGVGGYGYGILRELDTMQGRLVDNAGFFALDDFKSVSNEELYSRLLSEFPLWLKEAARAGVL